MKSEKILVNRDIRAQRVTLVDAEGNRKGEFMTRDAIQMAQDEGLDLVAVGGSQNSPVCKIMDFGKYLYDLKKKNKKNSSTSSAVKLKEVKVGFNSDPNIVDIRTRQAEKFLKAGHKVKITVTFRGRERTHLDMIYAKCKAIYASLEEIATIDAEPGHSGRLVSMVVSPKKQG